MRFAGTRLHVLVSLHYIATRLRRRSPVLDAVQSLEHPHSNLLALRQRHQQQTADLHSAHLELDQCRADLERARAEAADYQRALQATQQEMEFAQRAQREDSARVLSAREAEMARVRDECAAVRRELEEKEERLGAVERARETQRAAAERDMDALRARVAQLEDALASEKTSTETMKARHVELMQEHQQVQVVAARVDSVVRENTQLHSEAALHQRTIDRMSADNAVLTGRLRELTDGAGHPHHQRQSQSVHDQAVQVDVDAMKWEVFRGQLLRIDQALRVSTRRCAALEQELKRADQEMAVMRERVSGASVDEKQAAIDRLTRVCVMIASVHAS